MTDHGDQSRADGGSSLARGAGEEFFQRMLAAASDAVVTTDADGSIVYANPAVERLLGYDPDELCGRQFTEFVPDRFEDRYRSWLRRYVDGDDGTPVSEGAFEVTWVTAGGEERRLSVSAFAHEHDGRQLVSGFVREAPEGDGSVERLREEEALVEELFDTSPIAISIYDDDGDLLRANERAAELLGEDPVALSDDGTTTGTEYALTDADGDPCDHPVQTALRTGEPSYNEEVVVERPDGDRLHLSVNVAPVYGDDGEIDRVVTAAEDVTELKRSQFELRERREELETELSEVFSRITGAFFALDTEWNVTYVNDEAQKLLGRSETEIVGESIWEEFPEAAGSRFEREYERAMETQESVAFVEFFEPLSSWFEVRAYPSETGLSVYFQDVTERRARQQQLERYETIVETVEDGIFVLNDELEFSMINDAGVEMTGYDREELLGEPAETVVADGWDAVADRDAEMVAGERGSATAEIALRTKRGDTVPAEVTWVVRDAEDGSERVGVTRDITERKRRESELRDRVEQQRVLAEFSQHALEDRPLADLMDEAADVVAETLGHEYSKVLERRPDEDGLLMEAGHGWSDDVVGSATFDTEYGSQAGYTLLSREPVVVEDVADEDRFSLPDLLTSRGVRSGISTIVGSPDDAWGILETHTTDRRSYADYEVQFLQSIAHILYTAIRRREREQQLELYETITETVEDGIYVVGPDGTFSMVNAAYADMVGREPADLIGTDPTRLYDDETEEAAMRLQQEMLDGERSSATVEHTLETSDGDEVPIETTFIVRRVDDGYQRVGVARDVTDRKRFERTLTALHESSRELLGLDTAEEVAESVLQTVTDVLGIEGAGIYLYDEEDERLRPAAASASVVDIFGELPTFQPGDDAITWRAFADGRTIAHDDVLDNPLTYRDDTPLRSGIWIPLGDHGVLSVVSEAVAAFDGDDEELADLLAATTEAALDRVERERERRRHERELEAQNERLDAFASMLAHELRNPLEIAQIYLNMGVESGDDDAFREVERALDRIEEMIETLLVVTRRGGDVETTEVVDLGAKAAEWWDDLDPGGSLDVATDREIRADPSRLRQLLENLYRNAVEHGDEAVTVRVGDLPEGFYVEDDGPGIPEDDRDEVFEPGFSTSNVGIGFGLAVVQQLVDAHGWDVRVTESAEGGARFEFTGVETTADGA